MIREEAAVACQECGRIYEFDGEGNPVETNQNIQLEQAV